MTINTLSKSTALPTNPALALVLRQAKQLQRAARSAALAKSLPLLRRLLVAGVLEGVTLPELQRRRAMVQRKHLLQLLALEAGYASWEVYRAALASVDVGQLTHFDLLKGQAGYPNLWFASLAAAELHARQHGGRVVRVGQQAVIL